MKTMKKLEHLLIPQVAQAHKKKSKDATSNSAGGSNMYFEAQVDFLKTDITLGNSPSNKPLYIRYSGRGFSNAMGGLTFETTHETKRISQNCSRLKASGQFTLKSDESNDSLTGVHDGYGSAWTLIVDGGSGKFQQMHGRLSVLMINKVKGSTPTAKICGFISKSNI
jgi:hypothetical protein